MSYKAIIFDLDGTLLNSIVGIADAMNILLKRLNLPTHSYDHYKQLVGTGIGQLVMGALPESQRREYNEEQLVNTYREIYEQTWHSNSNPYDGIPEMLDRLTAQNIKMSILSNKSDDFTKRMVQKLLPKWKFQMVMGARPDAPRKPNPQTALEIAGIMGTAPEHCLFIGDSDIDMETGTRAGMIPVGVLWGFRNVNELLATGARALLKTPMELFDLH